MDKKKEAKLTSNYYMIIVNLQDLFVLTGDLDRYGVLGSSARNKVISATEVGNQHSSL